MPVVHVSYYTDPLCPWSWALEPSLRKLVHAVSGFAPYEQLRAAALAAGAAPGSSGQLWTLA